MQVIEVYRLDGRWVFTTSDGDDRQPTHTSASFATSDEAKDAAQRFFVDAARAHTLKQRGL
jgi:hypothetical protein